MSTTKEEFPRISNPKPKMRGSRKLLMVLLFFFIILLVVLFFNSSLSKIHSMEWIGMEYTDNIQAGQAVSLKVGDPFFAASAHTMESRLSKLNTVESVEVIKRFPGQVKITIHEYPVVAYRLENEGELTALLANGTQVAFVDHMVVVDRPILRGWEQDDPLISELCSVLSQIPNDLLADISEIKPDPSQVYHDKIKMYTRSQFEVTTTIAYLPNKIVYMRAIIAEEEPGYLVMLEANHRAPYEKDISTESEKEME